MIKEIIHYIILLLLIGSVMSMINQIFKFYKTDKEKFRLYIYLLILSLYFIYSLIRKW